MTTTKASLLALTAAFLSLSATAYAADVYTPNNAYQGGESAPVRHSWTGLWVGATGGYQFSNSAVDFDATDGKNDVGLGVDGLGADGLFGEAQIGFDKQIGQRTVVGVFGGYNLTDAEFSVDLSGSGLPNTNILSFDQEWGGVLGARVGVLKSQDTMFYLAGGWAFGEIGKLKSDLAKGGDVLPDQETDLSGWFGEVGMESRLRELGDNVYVTVAGRYTDYSAITLDKGTCGGDCSYNLKLDHDALAVMVGLKAKLGGF